LNFEGSASDRWEGSYAASKGVEKIELNLVLEGMKEKAVIKEISMFLMKEAISPNKFIFKANCPRVKQPVAIDGNLDEWQAIPFIKVDKIKNVRIAGPFGTITNSPYDWKGPGDLSVEFATQWDEKYLYVAFKVTDDVFNQPATSLGSWQGDNIQLDIEPGNKGSKEDWVSFQLANIPKGDEVYQNHPLSNPFSVPEIKEGVMESSKIKTKIVPGGMIYEAAIPMRALWPFEPGIGKSIGLSWLANDNDSKGRRGWIEWGCGIGQTKDPSLYGTLTFSE
jgi:hypothetical protein